MSAPKEALRFYESERHNVTLSHNDFSHEETFQDMDHSEELVTYLLSKNWDSYFTTQKSGNVICDTAIVNKIFEDCLSKFTKTLDTVQLFHIITDFYNISGKQYFDKLVQAYRKKLVVDLEARMGKMKTEEPQKIGKDRVQMAFNLIFTKDTL